MRVTNMIMIYFVMGAVMFGGGAISWDNSGVTTYFVSQQHGDVSADDTTTDKLSGVGGAITSLVGQFGGPVVLVWNLVVGLVTFSAWPLTIMIENHVPPRISILLGGSLTAGFYMALIALIRSSA